MWTPNFTRHDLQRAGTPKILTRGRELASQVEDLDWDEYSLWGALPGEGIGTGELLLHHTGGSLTGECSCPDAGKADLCAHMAALAWAYLGDDTELTDRLAALPHGELAALTVELADGSAWGARNNLVTTSALTIHHALRPFTGHHQDNSGHLLGHPSSRVAQP